MVNLGDGTNEGWNKGSPNKLTENVSCEDLEKMTAKDVRGLKRARQFALPKIAKQHSPRDMSSEEMTL